ncbi:MAG: zinc ribbon domain-containing protein [Gammaproteobacteria bacterium]|jgi:putative FmdB family regulatory protein|nr:zinc ribbon domain-containing protein [Gammaproteobacteria bacterium]
MPIYEYQCEACGAHLEKLQKISDPVLKDCPECNEASLKKMISATSFRLKGTGWYETDFKTGTKKHGAEDKAKDKTVIESKASTEKSSKTGESAKNSANNSANNSAKNNSAKKESSS